MDDAEVWPRQFGMLFKHYARPRLGIVGLGCGIFCHQPIGVALRLVLAAFLVLSSLPLSVLLPPSFLLTAATVEAADGDGQDLPPLPRTRKKRPKLDTALAQLAEAALQPGAPQVADIAKQRDIKLENGFVQVSMDVAPDEVASVLNMAEAAGARIETVHRNRIQARVPVTALTQLADLPVVRQVRQSERLRRAAITGEGLAFTGAPGWHAAGYRGAGVKIAIIDLGFANYTALTGTEVPVPAHTRSFRANGDLTGGGEVHGTAVAEIIHEMAPEAQLYLLNVGTGLEFVAAIDYAISQGVHIIQSSIGTNISEPGNGTGLVNDAVARAAQQNILFAQAAGNEAQSHWGGVWQDADSDGWLNFTGSTEVNTTRFSASAGTLLVGQLRWNDPFGASCNDYDFYIINPSGQIVARSEFAQTCIQDPTEVVAYVTPTSGVYGFAIWRYDANGAANFDLFVDNLSLSLNVPAGSIIIPADSPHATTVGAMDWRSPTTIESFSSQGPTKDGRTKPDLAGPDGVRNASYGSFYGTSASTPHVTGAAALVKQAFPSFTAVQIKSYLEGKATDLGTPGKDNVFGAGRLTLPPVPTELALTNVTPARPQPAPATFAVTAQSQDSGGVATPVLRDTQVRLSVKEGAGTLDGTTTRTILAGSSSVTFSDLTYSQEAPGVVLEATALSGDTLAAGQSGAIVVAAAGSVQFSAATFSVPEHSESATITVSRTGGSNGTVGVTAATTPGGGAIAGEDYTATTVTVAFADGDTAPKTLTVPLLPDGQPEADETVHLSLSNPTGGAVLGVPATATLTIVDDDGVRPTTLAITKITPESPYVAPGAFAVTVQVQDSTGASAAVTEATTVRLTLKHGAGDLGGITEGTLAAGVSSVTMSGVTYNVAEAGVELMATVTSGAALSAGESAPFSVLPLPPVRLEVTPAVAVAALGGTVDVALSVSSGLRLVEEVEAVLSFDPAFLEVVDADAEQPGVQVRLGDCALPALLHNEANNTTGSIHLTRGAAVAAPQPISGTCILGIIRLQVKAEPPAGTPLMLVRDPDFPATQVAFAGETLALATEDGVVQMVRKRLTFVAAPVGGAHGFTLGIAPRVAVQQDGVTVTSDGSTAVTLRVQPGTGAPGAQLTCTGGLSQTVVDGVVSFTGCEIDLSGNGYVLEAVAEDAGAATALPFAVRWAGDANGDRLVDIVDFSLVVQQFGKQVGGTGFDGRADLNGDNRVDIVDFSIMATLFGTRRAVLTVTPTVGSAGTTVAVHGTTFVANRPVTLSLAGVTLPLGVEVVLPDGNGAFTAIFTVPDGLAPATYAVRASQVNGWVVAAATFTVP